LGIRSGERQRWHFKQWPVSSRHAGSADGEALRMIFLLRCRHPDLMHFKYAGAEMFDAAALIAVHVLMQLWLGNSPAAVNRPPSAANAPGLP